VSSGGVGAEGMVTSFGSDCHPGNLNPKLGRAEGAGEKRQIQLPTRLQPPQPSGEKRLESLSNQFHHRSTRLATHKPLPYETGVARCKEQKHARSHTE